MLLNAATSASGRANSLAISLRALSDELRENPSVSYASLPLIMLQTQKREADDAFQKLMRELGSPTQLVKMSPKIIYSTWLTEMGNPFPLALVIVEDEGERRAYVGNSRSMNSHAEIARVAERGAPFHREDREQILAILEGRE